MGDKQRFNVIGQIQDLVRRTTSYTNPFLYYLPQLLTEPQFTHIDPEKALAFVKLALTHEKSQLVTDALNILNHLVDPHDGTLKQSGPDIFYGNQSFFWKELGSHTSADDIVMHILNKTLFVTSL